MEFEDLNSLFLYSCSYIFLLISFPIYYGIYNI